MIANQPWDDPLGSNCKNIALELSKTNRVLHVNPALDRRLLLTKSNDPLIKKARQVIKGELPAIEQVENNVWVLTPDCLTESINWISIPFIHDTFNRYNNLNLGKSIKKAIHKLNFSEYIVFVDNVIMRACYLKEILKPSLYIYYIRDYLISQPYYKKHGVRLERAIFRKSDIVVANSVFLRDYAAQYNSNSHYVGQGCELDVFNPALKRSKPSEFEQIKTPVIGYIGFLTALRLDIDLITHIATTKKEWTILLVGPEDEAFKNSNLHSLPNVIFTGNKSTDELPAYLQHCDICINPQLINDLTIGNYPRKIDEYLAMGKPTVATRTKAMEIFSDFCYLANGKQNYIEKLEKALTENSPEKINSRIAFANSHSWQKNVEDMCVTIEKNSASAKD